jgi:23S rRNA pseudouridine2604 synthase
MEGIRLNKFISDSGMCSRREADRMIENGQVFINGKRAGVGDRVMPGQKVMANGQEIKRDFDYTYIIFNKPVGVVTTTDRSDRDNIIDHVGHPERIFPVGRLDKDSQGLIILTSDGDIVNKILRAGNDHEKEYIVTVDKLVTDEFCRKMSQGVPILGQHTRKCKVTREAANVFRIVLKQGLNRQIRRMCEHFGYEVTRLERVRIMNIELGKLRSGEWRDLTAEELATLNSQLRHSEKTAAPAKTHSAPPKKNVHKPAGNAHSSRPGNGARKSSGRPGNASRKTGRPGKKRR